MINIFIIGYPDRREGLQRNPFSYSLRVPPLSFCSSNRLSHNSWNYFQGHEGLHDPVVLAKCFAFIFYSLAKQLVSKNITWKKNWIAEQVICIEYSYLTVKSSFAIEWYE